LIRRVDGAIMQTGSAGGATGAEHPLLRELAN
jgi:hypothetical protein